MNLASITISILIFIAGLNVPVISEYIIILASIGLLFRWLCDTRAIDRAFSTRFATLSFFALSYYAFTYIHGYSGLNEGIRKVLVILGSYALGYIVKSRNTPSWPLFYCVPLFCMAGGLICFSFLSVHSLLTSADIIQIIERTAPSFWDGSEINAPGLGANASLGMCLLPIIFFGKDDDCKGLFYSLSAIIISLMFAAGIYINVALQNRTPFLATAASLFFATIAYLHRHKTNPSLAIRKVALICLLAGIGVYFLAASTDFAQYNILTRFTEEGLQTERYEAWKTMLASLHHSLLGGKVVKFEISYVHNLWLDVIWYTGIVPFIFLVAFHLNHAICFKNIITSQAPMLAIIMIVGLGTSFFFNFMQEPTMSASVPYFAASCFFLGLVLRISQGIEAPDTFLDITPGRKEES